MPGCLGTLRLGHEYIGVWALVYTVRRQLRAIARISDAWRSCAQLLVMRLPTPISFLPFISHPPSFNSTHISFVTCPPRSPFLLTSHPPSLSSFRLPAPSIILSPQSPVAVPADVLLRTHLVPSSSQRQPYSYPVSFCANLSIPGDSTSFSSPSSLFVVSNSPISVIPALRAPRLASARD